MCSLYVSAEKCRQSSSCSSRENLYAPFAHKAGPHENSVKGVDKTGLDSNMWGVCAQMWVTQKLRTVYL